ncbi:MAG: hypothetical protein AAF628_34055 [Planctomycetota bacterium]
MGDHLPTVRDQSDCHTSRTLFLQHLPLLRFLIGDARNAGARVEFALTAAAAGLLISVVGNVYFAISDHHAAAARAELHAELQKRGAENEQLRHDLQSQRSLLDETTAEAESDREALAALTVEFADLRIELENLDRHSREIHVMSGVVQRIQNRVDQARGVRYANAKELHELVAAARASLRALAESPSPGLAEETIDTLASLVERLDPTIPVDGARLCLRLIAKSVDDVQKAVSEATTDFEADLASTHNYLPFKQAVGDVGREVRKANRMLASGAGTGAPTQSIARVLARTLDLLNTVMSSAELLVGEMIETRRKRLRQAG